MFQILNLDQFRFSCMSYKNQYTVEEIKQKTLEVIELIDNAESEQAGNPKGDPQKIIEFKRLTALSVSTFKLASSWAVKRFKI
ncbi:MAG: hypothetical protein ABIN89_24800 [Chitinophagaceae bacterium]